VIETGTELVVVSNEAILSLLEKRAVVHGGGVALLIRNSVKDCEEGHTPFSSLAALLLIVQGD